MNLKNLSIVKVMVMLSLVLNSHNLSAQQFTEVAISSGIDHVFDFGDFHYGGGVAVLDFNNDGFEDIYVSGGANPDILYKNLGNGSFEDVSIGAGIDVTDTAVTMGAIAGDINNDGFRDLFITTRSYRNNMNQVTSNFLLLNNGDETFTDITASAGLLADTSFSTSAAFGDYNNDGFLDIYVSTFFGQPVYSIIDTVTTGIVSPTIPCGKNYLYLNNGNETFSDVSASSNTNHDGCAWSSVFSDYDNDGDLDILIANDFGPRAEPNELLENEFPQNNFTSQGIAKRMNVAIHAMGVAVGDYDEDGYLDYYITDLGDNLLCRGSANGVFDDVSYLAGVSDTGVYAPNGKFLHSIGWGANFFDFDHDTYLDLFVSNGALNPLGHFSASIVDTFYNPNSLYRNLGNGTFTNVTTAQALGDGQRSRGSAVFDYDNDGDLDLFVVNQTNYQGYGIGTNPKSRLYRNDQTGENWVKIKLIGDSVNRDAIGARVSIKIDKRTFIREISGGSSHLSQNTTIAHFGLANYTKIDTIKVNWPGGGTQVLTDTSVNNLLTIMEEYEGDIDIPDGISEMPNSDYDKHIHLYPNPFTNSFNLEFKKEFKGKQEVTLEISDLTGKVIYVLHDVQSKQEINWSDKPKGLFIYKVKSGSILLKSEKLLAY